MSNVSLNLDTEDCISCRCCYDDTTTGYIDWNDDTDMPILTNSSVPEELAEDIVAVCPSDCYTIA